MNAHRPARRHRGRPPLLSPLQQAHLRWRVRQSALAPSAPWMRGKEVQHLLQAEFGVRYTLSGTYQLLRRLDLWPPLRRRRATA